MCCFGEGEREKEREGFYNMRSSSVRVNDDDNNGRLYTLNGDGCVATYSGSKRVRFKGAYNNAVSSAGGVDGNSGASIALVDSDHPGQNVGRGTFADESILLSSSSSSFITNLNRDASTGTILSIDALFGIGTRAPTHVLEVVQVPASTAPLVRFSTAAALTPHALTIDELGNCTVYGNVNVTGDLISNLSTTVPDLNITDPFVELNIAYTGTPYFNSGIVVNRGTSSDQVFMWRESDDSCVVGPFDDLASVQKVATRQDAPTNNAVMVWNNALERCNNYGNLTFTGSRLGVNSISAAPSPSATIHVVNDSVSDNSFRVDSLSAGWITMQINSTGVTTFGNTTQATTPTAGAVVLNGGLAVGGRLQCGGDINAVGSMYAISLAASSLNSLLSSNGTNSNLHLVANGTGKVAITSGGSALSGAPGALLHVQYSGSESGIDCFRVDDAATTDSSYFAVNPDGRVGINGPSPVTSYIGGLRTPTLSVSGNIPNSALLHETHAFFGNHTSSPNALGNLSFSGGRMNAMNTGNPIDTTNYQPGSFVGVNTDYAIANGAMTFNGPDTDGTDTVMGVEFHNEFGRLNFCGFKGGPYSGGATEYQCRTHSAFHINSNMTLAINGYATGASVTPVTEGLLTVDGGMGIGSGVTSGKTALCSGGIQFSATTSSTSTTTGALVVAGGVGCSGTTYCRRDSSLHHNIREQFCQLGRWDH
jgi:hypothetical protein